MKSTRLVSSATRLRGCAGVVASLALLLLAVRVESRPPLHANSLNSANQRDGRACPCQDEALCKPITTQRKEVFGFGGKYWQSYDWDLVTTVAWDSDPDLMCHAHSKGARVVLQASFNHSILTDPSARAQWVKGHVQEALDAFMDGTNFDYESPVALNSTLRSGYAALVKETADAFHAAIPGSQVSLDAAWGPFGIDGRFYDWTSIADAVDIFFVMAYDTRSQIYDHCLASANSPTSVAALGVQQYLDIGVPADKIVLGLPWYGYDYPCLPGTAATAKYCEIAQVPFRGAPCSDAAGREVSYGELWQRMFNSTSLTTPVAQDDLLDSKWFNYKASDGSVHQVWLDDPDTLAGKFEVARNMSLRGVGVWNYDLLDYTSHDQKVHQATQAMWAAFKSFFDE